MYVVGQVCGRRHPPLFQGREAIIIFLTLWHCFSSWRSQHFEAPLTSFCRSTPPIFTTIRKLFESHWTYPQLLEIRLYRIVANHRPRLLARHLWFSVRGKPWHDGWQGIDSTVLAGQLWYVQLNCHVERRPRWTKYLLSQTHTQTIQSISRDCNPTYRWAKLR